MINQEIRIGRVWRHSKRYPSWTCTKLEECVAWVIFSFYLSTWRLTLTREAVLRKRSTLSDSTVVVHGFLNVISCSILGLGERSRKNQVLGDLFLIFCCLDKHFSSFSVFVLRWYIYIFSVTQPSKLYYFFYSQLDMRKFDCFPWQWHSFGIWYWSVISHCRLRPYYPTNIPTWTLNAFPYWAPDRCGFTLCAIFVIIFYVILCLHRLFAKSVLVVFYLYNSVIRFSLS